MNLSTAETHTRPAPRIAKELLASSGFLLARLGLGFKGRALARLEQEGFEPYAYGVLAMLNEAACETQSAIADSLALDPSRLVAVLDSLEDGGLVLRKRDTRDRRRHLVTITADGERQLSRLRTIVDELESEFFAPLDPESRKALHELLLRLAAEHEPHGAFAVPPAA